MDITTQPEPFARWCQEAIEAGLFEAHWREVASDRDRIALEPDFEQFLVLERADMLSCFTARQVEGRLVGYLTVIRSRALHYKGHVFAFGNAIYVAPEHRRCGTGTALMQLAQRTLAVLGVAKITYHFKLTHDQAALMAREGYEAREQLYEKVLL